ncbi:MAG TPA: PHP domain-containing protein [Mycobacteriales bacterium]|nr:PHP domain-containing protein [Mycobacteriales bacterium]
MAKITGPSRRPEPALRIDLHTHSTASDGTDPPAVLVGLAAAAGLDVLALTDHETLAGVADATAALPPGMTLVAGAEISCAVIDPEGRRTSLHLLAYLFDAAEPAFAAERDRLISDREHRARGIVDALRGLGVEVTWEQLSRIAGGAPVGRPHVASALVELGVVDDVPSAFGPQWLGVGGRAHVRKHATDPVTAVRLVRTAGGVPVLAHPAAGGRGRVATDELIATLAQAGLAGLEADHPDHDSSDRARLRALAGELGLLVTGSSDYHGSRKPRIGLGQHTTAPEVYQAIVDGATGARPVTVPP